MDLLNFAEDELSKLGTRESIKNVVRHLVIILHTYESFYGSKSENEVVGLFDKLTNREPLTPLTSNYNEWQECGYDEDIGQFIYQNTRCSSLYWNEREARPYYTHAIIWRDVTETIRTGKYPEDGFPTFTGTVQNTNSSQHIDLPFIPTSSYVDVVQQDDGQYRIRNTENAFYMT